MSDNFERAVEVILGSGHASPCMDEYEARDIAKALREANLLREDDDE